MKLEIKTTKEIDAIFLQVDAGVRYWEDAKVNGVEDVNGNMIPCKYGDSWKPVICIETGVVINWKQGTRADIHYKVCDAGDYSLLDENKYIIFSIKGSYVPEVLVPEGGGYGDYIIMNIDESGSIKNWDKSMILDFVKSKED